MTSIVRYPLRQARINVAAFTLWIVGLSTGLVQEVIGVDWAVGGSFLLYFALGAFYARAAAVLIHVRWSRMSIQLTGEKFWMTFWRIVGWPLALIVDRYVKESGLSGRERARGLVGWFTAPVRKNEEQVADLLRRHEAMRAASRMKDLPPDERELLRQAATEFLEQANALKL